MNVFPKKKILPSSTIRLLTGIWAQRSKKKRKKKKVFFSREPKIFFAAKFLFLAAHLKNYFKGAPLKVIPN